MSDRASLLSGKHDARCIARKKADADTFLYLCTCGISDDELAGVERSNLAARREKEEAIKAMQYERAVELRAEEHRLASEQLPACVDCGQPTERAARDFAGSAFCPRCAAKHGMFPEEANDD